MKAQEKRITIALAAGICLSLMAAPATAQSSEGRGYGGPLNVGPNFEQGGQHTPPVYGQKPSKKRVIKESAPAPSKKKPRDVAKVRKPPVDKHDEPEQTTTTTTTVPSSTDSDTTAGTTTESTGTATTTAATCKKFDSTAGQTITVPCE